MSDVVFMFRIDIGLSPQRGYAAAVFDVRANRMKGIKGNTPEQLVSRIRNVILEELHRQKHFPLESEAAGQRTIIMPEDGDFKI
jgi:hypothetical protein